MSWKCINDIYNEKNILLFVKNRLYKEQDDRGDSDDIAICLCDEFGVKRYLVDQFVRNNFVEVVTNVNKFGSSENYKMLVYLTEKHDELDLKRKTYITTFINEFNTLMKLLSNSNVDIKTKDYMFDLVRKDYIGKVDELHNKYDEKFLSFLKNFIYAKTKKLKG